MMPSDSTTLAAAVRRHFALSQQELARYLGLTRTQVANVETGRARFSAAAERRLLHLAELLPAPHGNGQSLPAAEEPTAPDPDPLRQRLRRCRHLAGQTRFELHGLRERLQAGEYRQRGLAHLRAALLPAAPPAGVPDPSFDADRAARWLAGLEADTTAATSGPADAAQVALLEARLSALEHEAGLLAVLLGEE